MEIYQKKTNWRVRGTLTEIRHNDSTWCKGDETGLTSQLISTTSLPTQPMKGCTTPLGFNAPYSLQTEQQCGFFYIPQESEQWKSCETGPTVFCPYPRRLESLTICRCHSKGSTLSSVILRPWVLVWPGFEPTTSHSADRRLSNWANLAAEKNKNLQKTSNFHFCKILRNIK